MLLIHSSYMKEKKYIINIYITYKYNFCLDLKQILIKININWLNKNNKWDINFNPF